MELGEKLRQARLDAGLSQRQLCGEEITRNMLSLIENGSASPSMATLKSLASRLGKPVSYFLEEDVLSSPNRQVMETLRRCWDDGDIGGAAAALEQYIAPDPVYDRERQLLAVLVLLAQAEKAIVEQKIPYARSLLEQAEQLEPPYCGEELRRRRTLLWCRLDPARVADLPGLDEELLLRARAAWEHRDIDRCDALLDAAEDKTGAAWNLLRGHVLEAEKAYREAVSCFHAAEAAFPEETAPCLERCYRELEDYKQAYFYACRQKKSET